MGRLAGKVAIVTGAGFGFGEAIAHALVSAGANVLVADIAVESSQKVAADINDKEYPQGGSAIFIEFNATVRTLWDNASYIAKARFGKRDIVLNNAGATYGKKPIVEVSDEEFDRIIAVNIKSIYLSVSVVMPYFVERKYGIYVNISSVAGTRVRLRQVFYGGTKRFLHTGFAAEYGPEGVRLNSLCPLPAATRLLKMFSRTPDTPKERAKFAQTVPLRRMSEPIDVAMAAVYLASDEASFVSGVNLPLDGGCLTV